MLARRLDRSVTERLDPALAALPALAKDASGAVQSLKKAGDQVSVMADAFGQTAQRLNAPGGPIDQAARGAQTFSQAADRLKASTLPSLERAADDTGRAARQIARTAADVSANPQGFIYGSGPASPGPGEPGFVAPARNPQ